MEKNNSYLDNMIKNIYLEITNIYTAYQRPWIVGFSGGKDSTLTLQLLWEALEMLPKEQLKNHIYVIASDTGVENPLISNLIKKNINAINKAAEVKKLPISGHIVAPDLSNSFWVNLIGRGYPAPTTMFRWCTERMKILPTNQFIRDKVDSFGEVIIALGVRKAESSTREQLINTYQIKGEVLNRHSTLIGAYVYAPIVDMSTSEVWDCLKNSKSPWSVNNRELIDLYTKANANERPMVIDNSTGATGNGRFGCWICTVATRDSSMESLIKHPEFEWMKDFVSFRNMLFDTTIKERKLEFRDHKGRDGRVVYKDDKPVARTYKFSFSKHVLEELLKLEKKINKSRTEDKLCLISNKELLEIRRIWRTERQDWDDSVKQIYENIYGTSTDITWTKDDNYNFDAKQMDLLDDACKEHNISTVLLIKLVEAERKSIGLTKRTMLFKSFDKILNEDWRSRDQVLSDGKDEISIKVEKEMRGL